MATDLKVVQLHQSTFRDVAKTLRVIADQIDSGEISPPETVGIAMSTEPEVMLFGLGPKSDMATVALLFQAAIQQMAADQFGREL